MAIRNLEVKYGTLNEATYTDVSSAVLWVEMTHSVFNQHPECRIYLHKPTFDALFSGGPASGRPFRIYGAKMTSVNQYYTTFLVDDYTTDRLMYVVHGIGKSIKASRVKTTSNVTSTATNTIVAGWQTTTGGTTAERVSFNYPSPNNTINSLLCRDIMIYDAAKRLANIDSRILFFNHADQLTFEAQASSLETSYGVSGVFTPGVNIFMSVPKWSYDDAEMINYIDLYYYIDSSTTGYVSGDASSGYYYSGCKDSTSITNYGKHGAVFYRPDIKSLTDAQNFCTQVIANYKNPLKRCQLWVRNLVSTDSSKSGKEWPLLLNKYIRVNDTRQGRDESMIVLRTEFDSRKKAHLVTCGKMRKDTAFLLRGMGDRLSYLEYVNTPQSYASPLGFTATATDNVRHSANAERFCTDDEDNHLVKKIFFNQTTGTIGGPSAYKIKWEMKSTVAGGDGAYGVVRKNGSIIGSGQTSTSTTYAWFTQTFSSNAIYKDDYIELWIAGGDPLAGGDHCYVRNFGIYYDYGSTYPIPTISLD